MGEEKNQTAPVVSTRKTFVVTFRPEVIAYSGTSRGGEFTVEFRARDHKDAMKKARAYWRWEMGEGGKNGERAKISARVKEEV